MENLEEETEFDPLEDYEGFYKELQKETPRGAVIVGAAFLDAGLREILANFLIDEKNAVDELIGSEEKVDCPLSFFGARIKAAYCLGLISKDERDDLNLIRRVRNRFAHKLHDLSIDDKKIIDWCNSLQTPKGLLLDCHSHRDLFLWSVVLLSRLLRLRALQCKEEQRTLAKGFETTQVIRASGKD
jgi:mannitol operon repressor